MSSYPVSCVPSPSFEPFGKVCLSLVGHFAPSLGFLLARGEGRVRDCGLLLPVCRRVGGAGASIPAGISPTSERRGRCSAGSGRVSRGPGLQQAPGAKVFNLPALSNLPRGREKSQAGPLTRARPVGSPSQQASVENAHRVGPLSSAQAESPFSAQAPAVSGVRLWHSGTLTESACGPPPALGAVWLGGGLWRWAPRGLGGGQEPLLSRPLRPGGPGHGQLLSHCLTRCYFSVSELDEDGLQLSLGICRY